MKTLWALILRNTKLFFKDKGMFFTSLITPLILLILYATFLAKVYRSSFISNLPDNMLALEGMNKIIDGCVGGQLFSSLLAVSCITVAFCSNMIMVQDKVSGARNDLTITPVKKSILSLSYYLSTAFVTLIVCLSATIACFIYLACVGWYLTTIDVFLIIIDVFLLVMFGTVLSSIINFFLTSQGQISAVGTIVSAGYGFICGAYMPISQFGTTLQKVLSFLPGTYGTALIRNHALRGSFSEMNKIGFPQEVIEGMKTSIDCNISFFGNNVEESTMYLVLAGSVIILITVYILLNFLKKKEH